MDLTMPNTGFFIGAAKSLLNTFTETGNAHRLAPEIAKKLEALGHKQVILLQNGPAHKVLRMSREQLASYRMPIQQASQTELVKSGALQAALPREDDAGIPKIFVRNELRLVEFLRPEERSEIFASASKIFTVPETNDEVMLHLAEHRAIQDYMSVPEHSRLLNAFLRGEPISFDGKWDRQNLIDFSMLLISGLNALPNAPGYAMHSLPEDSPMFNAMLHAAETGQPFTPDYFLSTTAISQEQAADRHTPPNTSVGDRAVLIFTNMGKDVYNISAIFDQEKEKLIAPYGSFKVEFAYSSTTNKPVFILNELSKIDPNKNH